MDTKFGIGGTTRKLAESITIKDMLWTSILLPWFLVTPDAPTAGHDHKLVFLRRKKGNIVQ
jgi:hypothetical protein